MKSTASASYTRKEFKVIREGLTLMRQVEQKEAERNLAFCDSLIPVKQQELEGLKKGFNFEKGFRL